MVSLVFEMGIYFVYLGVVTMAIIFAYYAHDLPDISKLDEEYRSPSITILARNGEKIAHFGDAYGDYVPYQDFPQHLVDAVLSTEDRRFFGHFGIDPLGLLRAFYVNFRAGRVVQGGSTITQQLAKVVFLTHDRTLKRKVQELLLAFYLERRFSKEEIFTIYMNRIYLGSGNYGIGAAAKYYYDKPVKEMTLFESATIAGLIKAPSRFSPAINPDLSVLRADQVLENMVNNNKLSTELLLDERYTPGAVSVVSAQKQRYPYFADWINEQLPDYIGSVGSNLVVTTTLDPRLQDIVEKKVQKHFASLDKKHQVGQVAVVVLSPKGEILAMVGGADYKKSQFNRAVQALRQPGSAFKLFVYLAALEKGMEPEDIWVDEPVTLRGWSPKNWNNMYMGEVTLRDAFANSINTVAVKLAQDVGVRSIMKMARRLGIRTEMNNDLSSALGTSEVNLLELTTAYAHLANYGDAVWAYGISNIEAQGEGDIYVRESTYIDQVLEPGVTADMNALLSEVVVSGTGKRAKLDRPMAGKTGTSQESRDAWFVGYTPDFVAGVWVGNDDNTPMKNVGGGGFPAAIWKDIMRSAHTGMTRRKLPVSAFSVKSRGKNDSVWDNILRTFGDKEE